MKELLRQLLQAWLCPGCPYKEQGEPILPKPEITRFRVTGSTMMHIPQDTGAQLLYGHLDETEGYYATDLEGWGQALGWIYLTQSMPTYFVKPDKSWNTDCEDFAIWLKGQVSTHFGLNTFGIVIGDMPRGRHGFDMLYCELGWRLWEPNPGFGIEEPFEIGEHGYQPLYILI